MCKKAPAVGGFIVRNEEYRDCNYENENEFTHWLFRHFVTTQATEWNADDADDADFLWLNMIFIFSIIKTRFNKI